MKLVGLQIFRWDAEKPVILSQHLDLSQFSFFQRGTIKEHMVFHSRLICSRTGKGMRQSIEFEQKLGMCHIYVHQCGLAVTVLCDMEYPMRVAFSLINQILRAFQEVGGRFFMVSADRVQEFMGYRHQIDTSTHQIVGVSPR
eukprot:GHVU01147598.1.p1 GENE.GHVU01147598.1~~GHVU01147598.1.p1  ORF type:complete len:142 (-),score=5.77 GHVU01147598.1:1241-1666(-)